MKPFYYFCDNIEEKHEYRTIDNKAAGLNSIPNNWIHHNAIGVFGKDYSELNDKEKTNINGVLDYTKWVPPLYNKEFNENLNLKKRSILVSNRYNIEHGHPPIGFFDIECLYNIFNYLTEKGYLVIYKRPNNTEFTLDQNEMVTLGGKFMLTADVEGVGVISDYDLCNYYDKVINLNLLKEDYTYTYNELQMKLFSGADGFISTNGGGGFLCSYFGKPIIFYVPHGKELRPGYLTKSNSYVKKLSNANIHVVLDEGSTNDYSKLIKKIKEIF